MSMLLTCELYIDGVRMLDTGADYLSSEPTALDELSITWGRDTPSDQPDTSTCTFSVTDRDGSAGFLSALAVGKAVTVRSTGNVPVDGLNVAVGGTYDALTPGSSQLGLRAKLSQTDAGSTVTAQTAPGAGHGVALQAQTLLAGTGVVLSPDVMTSSPTAWDTIPKVAALLAWKWKLDVWLPAGVPGSIQFGTLASPSPSSPFWSDPGCAPVAFTGTGAWQTITGTGFVATAGLEGWPAVKLTQLGLLTWDQQPGELTWDTTPGIWSDTGPSYWLDNLQLIAPAGSSRSVLVWAGRISDLTAEPVGDGKGVNVSCTAVDFTSELANSYVGDQPWLAQPLGARFQRILTLAAVAGVTARLAPTLTGYQVSWVDVDNQAAMGLLTELAETADGVLWSATHDTQGAYLWLEDPHVRAAPYHLGLPDWPEILWAPVADSGSAVRLVLSACDVLEDGVQWTQDASQVVTRVDATWQDQTLDDAGLPAPTERTASVKDAAAETTYGVHRQGISTLLTTAGNATTVAEQILVRSRDVTWRISGLTWDTQLPLQPDLEAINGALDLLDGTVRLGMPVLISDLPTWSIEPSAAVYCEGGTWTFSDGRWGLAMQVSQARSQATAASCTWDQAAVSGGIPEQQPQWDTMASSVDWRDMLGVGGPVGFGPPSTLEGI